MSTVTVEILRCPHGSFAVAIAGRPADSSTRITPGKCCGSWNTVKAWTVDADDVREHLQSEERRALANVREIAVDSISPRLSVRALNCLYNANLMTVGAVMDTDDRALLRLNHLGKTTLREIRDAIARLVAEAA